MKQTLSKPSLRPLCALGILAFALAQAGAADGQAPADPSDRGVAAASGNAAAPEIVNNLEEILAQAKARQSASTAPSPASFVGSREGLTATRLALESAVDSLASATTSNKGGYVERARDDAQQAMTRVTEGIKHAQAHPETSTLPSTPSYRITSALSQIDSTRQRVTRNMPWMLAALDSLRVALTHLERTSGGDLGGLREKIIDDIDTVVSDVVSGINVASSSASTRGAGMRGNGGGAGFGGGMRGTRGGLLTN